MKNKLSKFLSIFKDDNTWNEKNIVGFLSFCIMTIFALTDIILSIYGKDLNINAFIYNSFLYLTIGSFGIDGLQKILNK